MTSTLTVRYFSILAQITGKRSEPIEYQDGRSVSQLLKTLVLQYPDIKTYEPYIRVAVNQTYVTMDFIPSENDEIALITPVSGG